MSTEPGHQRRLLEAVLAGELNASAAEVVDVCREDAQFAARLAQLLRTQQQLTAHGREVSADLAQPAPELEVAAQQAMRRAIGSIGSIGTVRQPRRWYPLLAVAAAALLVLGLGWWRSKPTAARPDRLGGFSVVATDDDRGLLFKYTLANGEYFRVTVSDAGGRVVYKSLPLQKPGWEPDAELVARWAPDWRVQVATESSDIEPSLGSPLPDWVPRR